MNLLPNTSVAPGSHFASAVVEEHPHNPHANPHQMMFQSHQQHVPRHSSVESLYRTVSLGGMEAEQIKASAPGNTAASAIIMCTTSSPAGFFANLNVENGISCSGYGVMRGLGAGNNSGSGGNTGNSRLKGQQSFSSRRVTHVADL